MQGPHHLHAMLAGLWSLGSGPQTLTVPLPGFDSESSTFHEMARMALCPCTAWMRVAKGRIKQIRQPLHSFEHEFKQSRTLDECLKRFEDEILSYRRPGTSSRSRHTNGTLNAASLPRHWLLSAPSRRFHAHFSVQGLALPEAEDLDSNSGLSLDATDTRVGRAALPQIARRYENIGLPSSPFLYADLVVSSFVAQSLVLLRQTSGHVVTGSLYSLARQHAGFIRSSSASHRFLPFFCRCSVGRQQCLQCLRLFFSGLPYQPPWSGFVVLHASETNGYAHCNYDDFGYQFHNVDSTCR